MSDEHRIMAVSFTRLDGCEQCEDKNRPHNVVVKCTCGETATGKTAHIWAVTSRKPGLPGTEIRAFVSLAPSFDWSSVHPVHEFLTDAPLVGIAELYQETT